MNHDEAERLANLRNRRHALIMGGASQAEIRRLDQEINEAQGNSLTGDGSPRTNTEAA